MMPNECHRGDISAQISVCVRAYVCAYPPRVHEKRRDMCREREERKERREDRQVTESSFTPFDSFAVRDTYALLASSYARTYARTHVRSSTLHRCEPAMYAGAARYGRKSFIYSFTTGPKKRGKYRPKEDL